MAYFCMSCKRETETSPCEHCGSEETAFVLKLQGDVSDIKITLNPESGDKGDEYTLYNKSISFLSSLQASIEIELTPEQAEQVSGMFVKFDLSQFIGLPCPTCGELFTQEFFDAGGHIIRASDDRWQHDHCRSQN